MAGFNDIKISRRLVLKRVSANTSYPIPAGAAVRRVQVLNRTDEAVSAFIVGTSSGGAQVVASTAVGSEALVEPAVVSPVISTSPQTLFIQATWGDGEVDIAIEYDELLDSKGKQPNADGLEYILHDPV